MLGATSRRFLAGVSLFLCSCEGGANGPRGADAGDASLVDSHRPDGIDDGGRPRDASRDAASIAPSPAAGIYGDGGIPKSVAVDPSCPSFEVAGYVPVYAAGILRGHIETTTAIGCCLPENLCGGAVPVEHNVVTPGSPVPTFAGWDPPTWCDRYANLIMFPTLSQKSCDYPFPADAASSDATTPAM